MLTPPHLCADYSLIYGILTKPAAIFKAKSLDKWALVSKNVTVLPLWGKVRRRARFVQYVVSTLQDTMVREAVFPPVGEELQQKLMFS